MWLLLIALVLFVMLWASESAQDAQASASPLSRECIEFVVTRKGEIDGRPIRSAPCNTTITRKRRGYCVCGDDAALPAAPRRLFESTCEQLCANGPAAAAIEISSPSACPPGVEPFFEWRAPEYLPPLPQRTPPALEWWTRLAQTLSPDDPAILPPGPRNRSHDFVAKGLRMQPQHVHLAQQHHAAFIAAAAAAAGVGSADPAAAGPAAAETAADAAAAALGFEGSGVVILGGMPPYLAPALVTLKALRRTGCELPVEFWFPEAEAPPEALAQELERLGARACTFPFPSFLGKGGFFMKAIVVAVSSFQKLLFLDADNIPAADPTPLLRSQEFHATGALFWRDFWDASWAPDAPLVLGVLPGALPQHTHESGQMVLDKHKVWPALVSALHYNLQSQLYAPLFTNFMGFGDKETFAFAMIAHGLPFHTFPQPPSSVGVLRRRCDVLGCWDAVATNTMLQHGAGGAPMFMHTNMPPKLSFAVPVDFARYIRRWQVVSPGVEDRVDDFLQMAHHDFGEDLEQVVHKFLLQARCHEVVRSLTLEYEATKLRDSQEPQLLRPRLWYKIPGADLGQVFEDPGLTGDHLAILRPRLMQHSKRWWNKRKFGTARRWNGTTSVVIPRREVPLWRDHY